MKNIKKNFIKRYKNLKEWRKKRQLELRLKKTISTVSRSVRLAYRTAMSFAIASIGTFVGNALYESIMKLREERK
jgi:hypothetical protein